MVSDMALRWFTHFFECMKSIKPAFIESPDRHMQFSNGSVFCLSKSNVQDSYSRFKEPEMKEKLQKESFIRANNAFIYRAKLKTFHSETVSRVLIRCLILNKFEHTLWVPYTFMCHVQRKFTKFVKTFY